MDSCAKVCHKFKEVADCDSLLILHRSKWRCLERTYSTVIDSLTTQVIEASSTSNQETLCQKLLVPLKALHHAMQEGERCFEDCICKLSEINHSWLVEKAVKASMSLDIIDIHLHDFIWAYATVKMQAMCLGIHFDSMELPNLVEETSILCKIWADEDAEGDLCTAQKQLRTNFMGKGEEETLLLVEFILEKLTHTNEDRVDAEAHHVLSTFRWADSKFLKRTSDSYIGKGSYGIVYKAMWLGGLFAVKEIGFSDDASSMREQVIQARMRHPNVINLVCCTKHPSLDDTCCLVMELMQEDLWRLMKRRKKDAIGPPFILSEAIDLMLQVAKAMEYLHSLNIMHRDLKSANILVSFPPISNQQKCPYTHLKIADFGNAKAKQMSSNFTTKPIGTRFWRAPEVFNDPAHSKYNKKADVYSFGLICYEILTGELPFKEMPQFEKKVKGGERPKLPDYCPRALASYIERCWDGNPKARPSFTSICRMLRFLKACILLENSDPPNEAHNWLAHPIHSHACTRITDMHESRDSSVCALPQPLNILLEMYWCRIVFQEMLEDLESSRQEGISIQHVEQVNGVSLGRSGWSITRLFNKFSKNFKVQRPPATTSAMGAFQTCFMCQGSLPNRKIPQSSAEG